MRMCTGAMKHVCLAWCSMLFKFTAGRAGRVPAAAAHAPSHCRPPLQSPASNSVCQMWMLLSSLALAKRWGSVGDQATELTVPLCPSSASSRSPAGKGRGGRCRGESGQALLGWAQHTLQANAGALSRAHSTAGAGAGSQQAPNNSPTACTSTHLNTHSLIIQRTCVPVVHIHLALLAARQHKPVVQAPQAGAHHEAALLVLQQRKKAGRHTRHISGGVRREQPAKSIAVG